jgi:hypothetical protein
MALPTVNRERQTGSYSRSSTTRRLASLAVQALIEEARVDAETGACGRPRRRSSGRSVSLFDDTLSSLPSAVFRVDRVDFA